MPLRVFGYDGAEYRTQLLKENRNHPFYPVVTLVLYFGQEKHWDKPLTLHEAVNVPEVFKPFVPDMKVNLFEIAFLTHEQVSLFKSDFRVVADYFVQKRERNDYTPNPDKQDHIQAVLQPLGVMTHYGRFEEAYNDSAEKEEVRNMCDVLDRVKRGIEQGIEQGITKGADEQARKTAMSLHKMGLSPADIARAVDRSLSIVKKWLGAGFA